MSKLVMGVSAAITAFILALTAGAVYAYRNGLRQPAAPTQAAAVVQQPFANSNLVADAAPPAVVNVSPQDAASVASKFINHTDVYSVELADWQGQQSYKVTFSSGDLVYVSLTGQVLASQLPPPPAVLTVTTGKSRGFEGGGSGAGGGGGGSSSGGYVDDGGGEHETEGP